MTDMIVPGMHGRANSLKDQCETCKYLGRPVYDAEYCVYEWDTAMGESSFTMIARQVGKTMAAHRRMAIAIHVAEKARRVGGACTKYSRGEGVRHGQA